MKKALVFSVSVVGFFLIYKVVGMPNLRYFKASEFGVFYPLMSKDLLLKLDEFRHRWGAPVVVSPAAGGIGRHGGGDSQHNVDKWGEVRAVDVFPKGMDSAADMQRAYLIAREIGFTGIGLYTDTKPSNMMHLDVRAGTHVATWSRVAGKYLGIGEVIA